MDVKSLGTAARRKSGNLLMKGLFGGLSTLGKAHPRARRALSNLEVISDVPYLNSGETEHLLDIYKPPGKGPFPVALYLHGGGFRILSKDTHWSVVLQFAARGYAVFNANYRLAPKHPFPAAIEDACAAYEWVLKNARRYGGDTTRLVISGESAGGNLTTAVTLATCYERPEGFARRVYETERQPIAAVPACGILQVSDSGRFARSKPVSSFVNDRIVECENAYVNLADAQYRSTVHGLDLANPLLLLERKAPDRPLPPFFASVGTKDPLLDDTRRLKIAVEAHGGRCEARYYKGELHAFQALAWRPNAKKCWQDTFDFLEEVSP